MNTELLIEWASSMKIPDQILRVITVELNKAPEAKANEAIAAIQGKPLGEALPLIRKAVTSSVSVPQGKPVESEPVERESPEPERRVVGGHSKFPGMDPVKLSSKATRGFKLPKLGSASPKGKQGSKKTVVLAVAAAVLLLVFAFVLVPKVMSGGTPPLVFGTPTPGATVVSPSAPEGVVPASSQTLSADAKKEWALSVVDSSITSDFLDKPKSFAGFLEEFPWNWVLYFLGVPLMLFMVYQERSSAREFSDIKLATGGIMAMLLAVLLAAPIAKWAAESGQATEQFVLYVVLAVGFLLNIAFQGGAAITGLKDLSVVAMGVYASGLLLRWWFPTDGILSMIGMILMVLGMVIQLIEINRGGAMARSLLGTTLMTVFFAAAFVGVFVLIQDKIAGFVIPLDPAGQAKAAFWLAFLTKSQIFLSVFGGLGIAFVVGMIYGSVFLQPKAKGIGGRVGDGAVDLRNLNFLEADSQGLFIQILFFSLPWIWILPQLAKLLM